MALWLFGSLLVQVTLAHFLTVRGVVPSFVLLVVIWYALRADIRWAALLGAIAGFCEDALAGSTGGAWTISTTVAAIAVSLLSRGFFADSIPLVTVIAAAGTLIRALTFWIVMGFEGYPAGIGSVHAHQAVLQAALNAIVVALAMLVIRRFDLRTG